VDTGHDPGPDLPEPHAYVLEVPALPAHVGTARLFAAAVARRFGADEDSIEELKLAVSEACTGAIRAQAGDAAAPVRVEAQHDGGRITFSIEADGVDLPWKEALDDALRELAAPTDDVMTSLSIQLIQGLFEDARIVENPRGGTGVRFSVRLSASSRN
jgi:anti-sigma regulatory factor (Ser/Thr protein kinase)